MVGLEPGGRKDAIWWPSKNGHLKICWGKKAVMRMSDSNRREAIEGWLFEMTKEK